MNPAPASEETALAVDLGGTNLRVARVGADGRVTGHRRIPTPEDGRPAPVIEAIVSLVRELVAEDAHADSRGSDPAADHVTEGARSYRPSIAGLGVAAPGPLDPEGGVVYATPNLAGWHDYPLAAELQKLTGLAVWINNDANLAALGESRFGAGRGFDPLVYLTVSTGVGGGIVIDGRIYAGAHGLAGELGHAIVRSGGPACNFGHPGCLEALASGTAIARRARERIADGVDSTIPEHVAPGGEITAAAVAAAAESGDEVALELLTEAGRALGYGVASFVNVLDPARVVIGGGVSRSWSLIEGPMMAGIEEVTMTREKRPIDVVPAGLGDDAGLIGAAAYALDMAANGFG